MEYYEALKGIKDKEEKNSERRKKYSLKKSRNGNTTRTEVINLDETDEIEIELEEQIKRILYPLRYKELDKIKIEKENENKYLNITDDTTLLDVLILKEFRALGWDNNGKNYGIIKNKIKIRNRDLDLNRLWIER